MGIEDGLDVFGSPLLTLPEDIGDGPFASNLGNRSTSRPAMAQVDERFRRSGPFEDNWLTRTSDIISVGEINIADTIPANSFRRVHQHFSLNFRGLSGHPVVRFWGDPMAIIEEGLGQLAPGPQEGTSLQRASDTLDVVGMLARPTMSVQTSLFQIRFRLPGYERMGDFGRGAGVQDPADSMNTAPNYVAPAGELFSSNRIETFHFSNSGSSIKQFDINYPVGNSIPIAFDIVNHNPIYAIQCAFKVFVYIDRSGEE